MGLTLETGNTGRNVTAESDGELYSSIIGLNNYVTKAGTGFRTTIQSNNAVKIESGCAILNGRHFVIHNGDSETVTIDNGQSGYNRIDLICIEYKKDAQGKETGKLIVKKGAPVQGDAMAPSVISGNILTGATTKEYPLYKVSIKGLILESVAPMYTSIGTMDDIVTDVNGIKQVVNIATKDVTGRHIIASSGSVQKTNNEKIVSQLGQSTTGGGYVGIKDSSGTVNEVEIYDYNGQGHIKANGDISKTNNEKIVSQLGQSTTGGGYVGIMNQAGSEIGALYDYQGQSYLKVDKILFNGRENSIKKLSISQFKIKGDSAYHKAGEFSLEAGTWIVSLTANYLDVMEARIGVKLTDNSNNTLCQIKTLAAGDTYLNLSAICFSPLSSTTYPIYAFRTDSHDINSNVPCTGYAVRIA